MNDVGDVTLPNLVRQLVAEQKAGNKAAAAVIRDRLEAGGLKLSDPSRLPTPRKTKAVRNDVAN